MPSGFYNGEVMFADNVSFDGTQTPGKVTTNGQLLIGSSVAPNIRVGTLASADGSVTITTGNGTIDLSAGGGSAIETINGDTGSITGSAVTIRANVASRNSGSTVRFVNSGSTSTLNLTDAVSNIMLGNQAGNLGLTGIANVGVGQQALTNLVSGNQNTAVGNLATLTLNNSSNNTAVGYASMINTISGQGNTAVGTASLAGSGTYNFSTAVGQQSMQDATATNNCAFGYVSLQNATGLSNDAFGVQAGQSITSGINNKCFGNGTLARLTTGSNNIGLGDLTGFDYVSNESNNILICNNGITAENNTIRIGNSGSGAKQQNRAFVAGITGVTVASSAPVAINSNGQLNSLGFGTSGQVLTSNGASSPTWQALVGVVTSVTGTLNRITSTGGTTPVIDISPSYVGQASITTLGTVTAGTWNATAIATTRGGTGLTSAGALGAVLTSNGTNWIASESAPITITGTLTSLQIKALLATPITIISAQGVGRVIRLISVFAKLNYGTSVFVAGAGQTIDINYTGSISLQSTLLQNGRIIASSNQFSLPNLNPNSGANTVVDNQGLRLINPTLTEITGNAGNDSTISYSITYLIIQI